MLFHFLFNALPFYHHLNPVVETHFHCLKFNPVAHHYYKTHPFFTLACKGL